MDKKEKQSVSHTYDNWKAITESDFVTLFIKTWFAFVATLRELYPEHKAYYEATGDSPYVRSYKQRFAEDFHFLCTYSEIEENLYHVYRYGQKMISERYPRFLVDDFYSINTKFSEKYTEPFSATGGFSGMLEFRMKAQEAGIIKVELKCTDKKFAEKSKLGYLLLSFDVDYQDILDDIIRAVEKDNLTIKENGICILFYPCLFSVISKQISDALGSTKNGIPEKGNKQLLDVFSLIQAFCSRAAEALKRSCLDPGISDEHRLLAQAPITEFLQSYHELSKEQNQRAYLWFVGFVYRLRNALFHEIIDPLDSEWQLIFKNAYLVLKQIVDINIYRLKMTALFIESAPLIFENEFRDAPPPDIPIAEKDAEFIIKHTDLISYNAAGARVKISAIIICNGQEYQVDCNVRWDDKLENPKVKNVVIH